MNWHSRGVLAACAAAILAIAPYANASQSFDNDRGDIAARVSSQNTFQHNGADSINWVQWRNEVRFDLRYDIIQQGVGNSWGPIKQLKFNILWRGRYDPVYQLRDSYKFRDYNRGDFEFPEGKTPRELFFDVGFQGALKDLSLRIGKQQVVWGEADLFRSLDIVNPLDLRQSGFVGEDFADFRQPLWILKGLYNFGNVADFWNEAGVEAFWSPNSRPEAYQTNLLLGNTWKVHATQSVPNAAFANKNSPYGFNRDYSIPFAQMRTPWEFLRVGALNGDSPAVVQNPDGPLSDFMYRIKNDVPPTELSWDAMMAGVRLLGTTYGNAYFTLNYLYKRTDGASASAILTQLLNPAGAGFGTLNSAVLGRALQQAGTPDLNGNGIPDGQEQQIQNCLQSKYPTGPGQPTGAGEIILDPRLVNPAFTGNWHGSVYSDPAHPELATGVKAGNKGSIPGSNQLATDHVPYQPVFPVGGDGLAHSTFCADIPVFHPWTHIIGGTMTYNDYDYTGLVFRLEQSFSTKEPRQNSGNSPQRLLDQQQACTTPTNPFGIIPQQAGAVPTGPVLDPGGVPLSANCIAHSAWAGQRDFETRLKRYVQTWRSMVGFDYLRSISTNYGRKVNNELIRSLLTDQWFFTFQFLNTYDSHADSTVDNSGSFTAKYNHWNPFFTVSGSGFFMHQTLAPIWAFAADASTGFTPLFFLQIKYFLTPKLEMRVGEVLYMGSRKNEDPGGLHYYADRDNFYVRLTYYLL